MGNRARDRHWVAESRDMLEKLRHDHERLRDGIGNLRNNPKEAHYATYDLLTTAYHLAEDWLDGDLGDNGLFALAGNVVNGVKHSQPKTTKEETYDEGDFSSTDFSAEDFNTDDLYFNVSEDEAQKAEKGTKARGLDPKGIVQGQGMEQNLKKVSVLVLADRLIESLEQEIQEGSTQ